MVAYQRAYRFVTIKGRVRLSRWVDRWRAAITMAIIVLAVGISVFVLFPLVRMQWASRTLQPQQEPPATSLLGNRSPPASSEPSEPPVDQDTPPPEYTATRAGISEAVRNGDLEAVKAILAEKPELIHAENPYPWANLEEMRVWPWASKPAELAVIFNQVEILAYLLSISEKDDHPLYGYFEAFDIANKAKNEVAIDTIVADVLRRARGEGRVHATTDSGRTFLHFAAEYEHVGLMQSLLELGAEPDAQQHNGRRPIHHVAGDNAATRLLLDFGADFDLWVAAAMGDLSRAREILSQDPSQVAVDFKPYSHHSDGMPLVAAAERGHTDMVRLLLENGADVDGKLPGREFGDLGLGLIHALEGGHLDVVDLLLDHGADIDAWVDSDHNFKDRLQASDLETLRNRVLTEEEKNPTVESPSFKAWTGEIHGDIRELPPQSPAEGLGTISAAIVSHNRHHDYENYKEIIAVMLEQGADQNAWMTATEEEKATARDRRYWHREFGTPLHWLSTAYLNKHNYSPNPDIPTVEELVDLADLFVEHGANLEARHPISNHTPLSSAVAEGIYDYVDFLLDQGAQIHHDDPPETNPLRIAERLGLNRIAVRLKQ